MINKLIRLVQYQVPEFRELSDEIPTILRDAYSSNFFWTPRYQEINFTEDYLKYLRYLQRKKEITHSDRKEFTESILTEYHNVAKKQRPNIETIMQKDVYIPRNAMNKYHGKVDWIYSANGLNMVPIMYFKEAFNPVSGIGMAVANMFWRTAMQEELNKKFPRPIQQQHINTHGEKIVYGYSIMTTGNEWQLIRVNNYLKLQKSVILEGRNTYRTMYHDEHMITVLLGMLDYALDLPEINVQVLEKAYQYLDESRYMILAPNAEEAQKNSWLGKILFDYYRKRM